MAAGERLKVGVIMGSDSDMSTMIETGRALRDAGMEPTVDYEFRVVSAHRTPEWMTEYAHSAEERGLQVIIPGAGGSAHLPGMVASETVLPVAGVAVTSNPDVMNRALGSLIGMPEGKPLATFQSRRGAYQAGVLATRIFRLDSDQTRVGILASIDHEGAKSTDLNHTGRALGMLGLREGDDYEYLTRENIIAAGQTSDWAKDRGIGVVVGSANVLRHESYDLSSMTDTPVLGVATPNNADVMGWSLDSLVNADADKASPVAAFQASSGAFNAGLKAARILALNNPDLRQRIVDYNESLKATNVAKDSIMSCLGDVAYAALSKEELQQLIDTELDKKRVTD